MQPRSTAVGITAITPCYLTTKAPRHKERQQNSQSFAHRSGIVNVFVPLCLCGELSSSRIKSVLKSITCNQAGYNKLALLQSYHATYHKGTKTQRTTTKQSKFRPPVLNNKPSSCLCGELSSSRIKSVLKSITCNQAGYNKLALLQSYHAT